MQGCQGSARAPVVGRNWYSALIARELFDVNEELSYNNARIIYIRGGAHLIIKSSTSLRNDYSTISNLAHDTQEPVYITKNGEGDLVIMSIDAFEKREELIKLRAKIELAEQSRLSGETVYTLEDSKQRLENLYEKRKV